MGRQHHRRRRQADQEGQRARHLDAHVAEENIADYNGNLAALGVDQIDHFPRATECMPEIIEFIEALIERGFAYESDGDVYFDVGKDPEYGKLSNRSIESMQGEGGAGGERKRHVADFALWKAAKPGEPSWDSPWGKGRPGWHIECSAMSMKLLGETFDIHGGGLDLMFPPSRKRNRPKRMLPRQADGHLLGPQRPAPRRHSHRQNRRPRRTRRDQSAGEGLRGLRPAAAPHVGGWRGPSPAK